MAKGIEQKGSTLVVDTDALSAEMLAEGQLVYTIEARNPFYSGWLGFLLGQVRPSGEHAADFTIRPPQGFEHANLTGAFVDSHHHGISHTQCSNQER